MKIKYSVMLMALFSICSAILYSQIQDAPGFIEQFSTVTVRLNSVSAVNSNICWACGDSGKVLLTTNGGINWLQRGGGSLGTYNVNAIAGIDSSTALATITKVDSTKIYRTSNGGFNWISVYSQPSGNIRDIIMITPLSGYAYGDPPSFSPFSSRWTFLKTTNGGISWDSAGLRAHQYYNEKGNYNSMCIVGSYIWFGTNNKIILKSTNSGVNWSYTFFGDSNSYCISFDSNGIGFAGGNNNIYKSTDWGSSFSSVILPGTGPTYTFANLQTKFWYARKDSVFYSSNGGASFGFIYKPPGGGNYKDFSFVYSPFDNTLSTITGWGVRDNAGISKYTDVTGINFSEYGLIKNFKLYQNYPNPFNPLTKIIYENAGADFITVKIYDIKGKEVFILSAKKESAGIHEITWDCTGLPSGIYFINLSGRNFSISKKAVLLK